MANELTLFDQPQLAVPDYVDEIFGDEGNIEKRASVPSMGYEGKVWSVTVDGNKTKLVKRNEDGDEEPLSVMRVVVLNYNKRRGRSYYAGSYNPEQVSAPLCWSDDGEKPDPSVKEPQCTTCAKCPMDVKGSSITDSGKEVKACSSHRMLALVPAAKLDHMPLRMKIAVTSDYDKQSPELEAKGWMAFSQYVDFLAKNNVNHTAKVVTKMRFDPNVAYPKILFSPDRWLERDEMMAIAPVSKSEEVEQLLKGTWTVNGTDGVDRGLDDDKKAEIAAEQEAKKKAEIEAQKKAEAEKKAKAAAADDDDGDAAFFGDPEPKAETKSLPADEKPAKVDTAATGGDDVPADVSDILAEWDD